MFIFNNFLIIKVILPNGIGWIFFSKKNNEIFIFFSIWGCIYIYSDF